MAKFVLDREGVGEILKSPEMLAACVGVAEDIADRATVLAQYTLPHESSGYLKDNTDGFDVEPQNPRYRGDRVGAGIYPVDGLAWKAVQDYNVLLLAAYR